jgi:hypothetical protein
LRRRRSGPHVVDLALQEFDLTLKSVGGWEAGQFSPDLLLPPLGVALVALPQVGGQQADARVEFGQLGRLGRQLLLGSRCLAASFGGLSTLGGQASLELSLSGCRLVLRA